MMKQMLYLVLSVFVSGFVAKAAAASRHSDASDVTGRFVTFDEEEEFSGDIGPQMKLSEFNLNIVHELTDDPFAQITIKASNEQSMANLEGYHFNNVKWSVGRPPTDVSGGTPIDSHIDPEKPMEVVKVSRRKDGMLVPCGVDTVSFMEDLRLLRFDRHSTAKDGALELSTAHANDELEGMLEKLHKEALNDRADGVADGVLHRAKERSTAFFEVIVTVKHYHEGEACQLEVRRYFNFSPEDTLVWERVDWFMRQQAIGDLKGRQLADVVDGNVKKRQRADVVDGDDEEYFISCKLTQGDKVLLETFERELCQWRVIKKAAAKNGLLSFEGIPASNRLPTPTAGFSKLKLKMKMRIQMTHLGNEKDVKAWVGDGEGDEDQMLRRMPEDERALFFFTQLAQQLQRSSPDSLFQIEVPSAEVVKEVTKILQAFINAKKSSGEARMYGKKGKQKRNRRAMKMKKYKKGKRGHYKAAAGLTH